ncbi:MAG: lysozyme [Frankiaceae bacterium]|nr:lysozyme [Frankiaceae bacterium]
MFVRSTTARPVPLRIVVAITGLLTLGGVVTMPRPAIAVSGPTGIDISRWQHPNNHAINWGSVRNAGHDFVIIKATESTDYVNPYFAGDAAGARSVGMMVGAYDFARPSKPITASAVAEARHYVDVVGSTSQPGTLPPVLDLEQTGGLTDAELIAWTHTWLDTVTGLTGRMPIIYTYKNFWSSSMNGTAEFGGYPLWLAFYNSNLGGLVGNWPTWTMWQYSSSGSVPGISGRVDMNRFNGSLADLAALANGAAAAAFAPSSPFPPVNVAGTAGNASARISWLASYNGGAPITSYTVTVQPGLKTVTVPASRLFTTFAGLLNGTTYHLSVTATNALGTSDPVTVRVTPNVQTTLTLRTSASAISYGGRVVMSARLTRNDTGAALAGRSVIVEGRTSGAAFQRIATLHTNATGAVSIARSPLATSIYRLRYAGGAEAGSIAASQVIVRAHLAGRFNFAVARVGAAVILSGRVSPTTKGFVYRQMFVGRHWTTLDRTAVGPRGTFAFRVLPVLKGAKLYRLSMAQSARFGATTSAIIHLRVV